MRRSLLSWICCPRCSEPLEVRDAQGPGEEIESGHLACTGCQARFPIVRSIPRFVDSANYSASFGLQWNRFRRTQLDSYTGVAISRERFLRQTAWAPEALQGALVLDVGCGAGRFAEIALSLGAQVVAIDYSDAIDACRENLAPDASLHLAQANVYSLPLRPGSFDFIYCFGVLQHTPDPRQAFLRLPRLLKPGGGIAVDTYSKRWTSLLHPKYALRPISRRLPRATLLRLVERMVPTLLPASRAVARVPLVGSALRRMVPVANYQGIYPLTESQLEEFAVLDTFDWLSPAYDRPQTPKALLSWLREAGLQDIEVLKVFHLVGRGRRPHSTSP